MAAQPDSDMLKRFPLIVVLGATGTGKSKLAVQLAKAFHGEIVSADSMQLYRGLDIVTNKVTDKEAQGVPHHCLNFLDPLSTYTVVDFRDKALPIVERLMADGKLAVVVGGTHYYIESILWKVLVSDGLPVASCVQAEPLRVKSRLSLLLEELEYIVSGQLEKLGSEELGEIEALLGVIYKDEIVDEIRKLLEKVQEMSEEEAAKLLSRGAGVVTLVEKLHPEPSRLANRRLHARLKEVDPVRAERLHYNDVRKIKRSLEIYEGSEKRHSDVLQEQQLEEGGSKLGGPLRYPNTAIFWIQAEQDVLDKRLDDRVDDMIGRGLVKELEDFHKKYNESRIKDKESLPYTQGVFQSIGFKEFHSYLTLPDKTVPEAAVLLQQGIEALKIATRRYARRQVKWIRGRFLKPADRQVPPVYGLDGTDPREWDEKVLSPAVAVVKAFLDGGERPQPLPREKALESKDLRGERICRTCMRIFIGDHQWEMHLKSKKHHAMVRKKQKQEKLT